MRTVLNRIYSDYLMPSRLASYDALLGQAHERGYAQVSVRAFFRSLGGAAASLGPRVLVHRHDIDSDLRTARKMFALETRHGAKASYYFRLSTLDYGFMREIEAYGSEASYHYEEPAQFAKSRHIKSADELRRRMPEIQQQFLANFERIGSQLPVPMTSVASHGDFANRRLQVFNYEMLRDRALRARCGIECESYDPELLDNFDLYISDRPYPRLFHPVSPFDALGKHARICFLTHPNNWETNWAECTQGNVRRLVEGLAW